MKATTKVTLYGISNCDTIKKAKTWLQLNGIDFVFHDYRKQGLDQALLQSLEAKLGWEAMLNRRGTTWRQLPEDAKNSIDRDAALTIMLQNPAIIKRPILVHGEHISVGFSEASYQPLLAA